MSTLHSMENPRDADPLDPALEDGPFGRLGHALPCPAFLVGPDGLVRQANGPALELFGDTRGAPCPLERPATAGTGAPQWDGEEGGRRFRVSECRWEESGRVVGRFLCAVDVTDLDQARRLSARREGQFAAIVAEAQEGVAIAAGGRLAYVNPFMERLTGHDAATLCAGPFAAFLHEDDRVAVLDRHHRRLAGHSAPSGHTFRIVTRGGGVRWVRAASTRIEWEGGAASLNLLSDITAERLAELTLADLIRDQEAVIASRTASLREANQTLEREIEEREAAGRSLQAANERLSREIAEHERTARKLTEARKKATEASRAKSVFLANMSHEIRTPLNIILGMADMALRPDSRDRMDNVRALEMIREAGASLRGLLGDLLDLSRVEAGRLTLESVAFSPAHVLTAALDGHAVLAERQGLILAAEVGPDVPETLVGDPGRLGQILGNLIGNALKFTPKGRIDVSVRRVEERGKNADPAAVTLLFSVQDTGIGIAPEKTKAIFQTFRQADEATSRQFGGSGLGLAICRRLVGLLGGRIRVKSRPGCGSEFTFTARFRLAEAGTPRPKAGEPAWPPLPPLDILLAEDSDLAAEMLLAFLTPRGHRVTRAVNGLEALGALAMRRFDLVFMDIRMPVMDGLEAIRAIRGGQVPGHAPDLPILALTAHGETRDRDRILAAGATAYLAKPVDLDRLLGTMARVMAGQGEAGQDPDAGRPPSEARAGEAFDCGRAEALENLGEDVELYDRLASIFLRDTPVDRQRLRASLDAADLEATIRLAHGLKGNAGVIGATPAASRARDLERAAREGRMEAFAALTEALEAELDRVQAGLAARGIAPAAP
uniref:histidine kinase n=1 Tax=Desulfovibrio sp. U5L TaxID=596152 RepID=I2PYL9_9BACT